MARLSSRTADLHASPIRAMLNASMQPDMISFAGGLPDADSFSDLDLPSPPASLLQYGPTEGEPELREVIAGELQALGLDTEPGRILILSGSQQGIDLAAKLTIDPGTRVALESPSYLAAVQVFRFFGGHMVPLDRARPQDLGRANLTYVTPTFQNPTGYCWSHAERAALAQACDAQDCVLFEDDPYRDLVFGDCDRQPICSMVTSAPWIYQGSFSKTVAPGLRLGFLTASADLFPHLVHLKQAADLHTNRLSQWSVLHYLKDLGRADRMTRVCNNYKVKRDRFARALTHHLGNHARWDLPQGGLFFWLELDAGIDTDKLLAACLARGVLFTPGHHFMIQAGPPCLRLNFSLADAEQTERGLRVIGEELKAMG
jgi:2-aminoadipate transaminase